MSNKKKLVFLILVMIFIYRFISGFGAYFLSENGGEDLLRRWRETHYLMKGYDPLAIMLGTIQIPFDPVLGRLDGAVYPPWAYIPSLIFVWPAQIGVLKIWFLLCQIGCYVALWGALRKIYRICVPKSRYDIREEFIMILLFAAGECLRHNLRVGNYTVFLFLCLLNSFLFNVNKQQIISGIFLFFTCIKPTWGLPLLLVFVMRKNWIPVFIALGLMVFSSVLVFLLWKVNPIPMLFEMKASALMFSEIPMNFSYWLGKVNISATMSSSILPLIGLLILFIFLLKCREDILCDISILCLVSRIFFYHQAYDNVLTFPAILYLFFKCFLGDFKNLKIIFQLLVFIYLIVDYFSVRITYSYLLYQIVWIVSVVVIILNSSKTILGKDVGNGIG